MSTHDDGRIAVKERKLGAKGVDSTVRRVNAVLAAALAVFFFGHALLGAASQSVPALIGHAAPTALIVCFAGIAGVHIAASILTTYFMFTDTVRPPSAKKRAHQWLKWASGAFLAAVAAGHALCPEGDFAPFLLATLVVLLWHTYVGCKSLVHDLSLPRSFKLGLRIAAIIVALGVTALVGAAVLQ